MKVVLLLILPFLICNCSTLPKPGATKGLVAENGDAAAILASSARASGDPWKRYKTVKVEYAGEWTNAAAKIQPVIVDRDFRKESIETYFTRRGLVEQIHSGPGGTKLVRSSDSQTEVSYNGKVDGDSDKEEAAAMVADAYTLFTFGSSWLNAKARDLEIVGKKELAGEECLLIQGKVSPGFGMSESDSFIAWIGSESKLLRRVQFTIDGVETTKGADVSVDFSDFKTASDGSIWPTHFLENVERPIHIKAHEWDTRSLSADGKRLLPNPR
ncbi:MAG: hypothetical protein NWT08_10675 [Akkermansiaceae bacterium]|jgi:hypothetical protein|nr:hypothetical protein [Akkermansiaceae bacterium]MDP4647272.1 hypothetical protein [Akkermansiaceae bacterium]MDP4722502.1 hypothetical protein [Akkermansiaceae bacterium]MDP4781052.1 hypothetical protein [Akkermansiaceae bacterium]MDP4848514.1 hypothetical protein [Akkermansiaceae bacterium]